MLNLTITPAEHKALVSLMRKVLSTGTNVHVAPLNKRMSKKSKAEIKKSALNELQKACPTIQPFLKK